jgi:hypothetical protein
MNIQPIPAEAYRKVKMSWIWIAALVVVVLVLKILDPLGTIAYLIENGGIGQEGKELLWVVGIFTFPLTVSISLITFLMLMGVHRQYDTPYLLVGTAAILFVSGVISRASGIGISPSYEGRPLSGYWWISIPLYVITGYIASYGLPLTICALVIGIAIGFQVERVLHDLSQA